MSDASAGRAPTIRVRLIVWLSTLLTGLLLLSSALDYRHSVAVVDQAYDLSLSDAAFGLVSYLNVQGDHADFELPPLAARLLETDSLDTVLYRVVDPQGRTLAGDQELPMPPTPVLQRLFYDGTARGLDLRVFAQPISTSAGTFLILLGETTLKRSDARWQILWARVAIDALILSLTLGLVWFGVGRAMRPLERLATQVAGRSGDDLRPLPHQGVPGEARPLVAALNALFGQIGAAHDGQRRFIENAAHQLRTPLAALKGQLELVVAETARALGSRHALTERLGRVRQATDRLTHLANQLLTLARSERSSHETAGRQTVSLPPLVDDAIAGCLDAALQRGQDLGAETQPVELRAVSWELRELLTNLIDNAIRYTQDGGTITVRCGHDERRHPYLEVEDNGCGIAPGERARVFERFYRSPGSPAGGSGLGLSIVMEIARLYGAEVAILDPLAAPALQPQQAGAGAEPFTGTDAKPGASAGPGTRVRVTFAPA